VLVTAGLFIILLGMRAAGDLLAPFLFAVLLAIITVPLIQWLRGKGAPSWLALGLTIVLFLVVIAGFIWLVTYSVNQFASSVSDYQARFSELAQTIDNSLARFDIDIDSVSEDEGGAGRQIVEAAAGFIGGLASGLANWGLILMTGVFLLVDGLSTSRKVNSMVEEGDTSVQRIQEYTGSVRRFMSITAGIGFITAIANMIFLWALGVDFVILWGILSFVLNFVPNIGFIISLIPPAIMALLEFGVGRALIVVAGFIVINGFAENVIKPRYIADDLDLSVATSFVSLTLWTWVLGPLGAILAVPLTILVQSLLAAREETRWIAYMMGTGQEPYDPTMEPAAGQTVKA
jgi:predicted PurR-regulated permease PerM